MSHRQIVVVAASLLLAVAVPGAASAPGDEPDGSPPLIAFVSTRDGVSEIYVMNVDGNRQLRLMINPAQDAAPAFSPDGKRIAFSSNREGEWDVFSVDVARGDVERLTTSERFDGAPSWSPDGAKIAFVSARDGKPEIYVMNADGSGQTRVTNNAVDDAAPAWLPQSAGCGERGGSVTFASEADGDYDIYTVDTDGEGLQRVADTPTDEFNPSWSEDCASLAFDRPVDGNYDVYVMHLASGTTTRVTDSAENDSNPAWLPGDARIAFTSLRDGHQEIYVTTPDSVDAQNLTHSFPADDFDPAAWAGTGGEAAGVISSWRRRAPSIPAAAQRGIRLTCTLGPRTARKMRGTRSSDVICSRDANHRIEADRGHDRIRDRGGADVILGGRGRDTIYAADGVKDTINGGPGVDTIHADRKDDVRRRTGDLIGP